MNYNKRKYDNHASIRNYSFFIAITFLIVFLMRDNGKNLWLGISLSLIPLAFGVFANFQMRKNKK